MRLPGSGEPGARTAAAIRVHARAIARTRDERVKRREIREALKLATLQLGALDAGVYGPDPGLVGRCPGCDDVLLRIVRTPDAVWLDLGGVTSLRVPAPAPSANAPAEPAV